MLFLELSRVDANRAGNRFRVRFKIHGVAKVNNGELFAGVEFLFQLVHGDAGDAKLADESTAGDKLVGEIGGERADKNDAEPASQGSGPFGDTLDFAAEDVAETEKSASPDKRTGGIEKQKAPVPHVKNSGERRSDGAKAGNELGDDEGASALFREDALGAANAGIRFNRDLAEELQDFDAFAAAEMIPERISRNSGEGDDEEREENIHLMRASERASGEKQGNRGERKAALFRKNPSEQNDVAVMEEKLESAVHGEG